jgi:hypothetical protein
MKQRTIKGKVVFEPLEGGVWGIVDAEGIQWMPLNFPAGLKKPGVAVRMIVQEREDILSFAMWGRAVTIRSYHIEP